MPRLPKGSNPSVPVKIRMNSDLSDAVRAAMKEDDVTLTRILEEGARLWLDERARVAAWKAL